MLQGHHRAIFGHSEPEIAFLQSADRISVLDAFGETRQGVVFRLPRWDDSAASVVPGNSADFSIVLLGEPPAGAIQPPPKAVACAPGRPLGVQAPRIGAPAGGARSQQVAALTATEAKLLSQGRLHAGVELRITPQEVFGSGEPRFDLLARDLLACNALARCLEGLALALSAPQPPAQLLGQDPIPALRSLLRAGEAALRQAGRDAGPEAADALDRLSRATAAEDAESFLISVHSLYPRTAALLEDVYLVRALVERPAEALETLAMRRFVSEAVAPVTDIDLELDRAVATEELQFVSLITQPQQLDTARAAVDGLRRRYRALYLEHHREYWTRVADLHLRLQEAQGRAEVLGKLNTLAELGPRVGEEGLAAYRDLLEQAAGCPFFEGLEARLGEAAVCPACHLSLGRVPPGRRVAETLQRIDRAIDGQLGRLSSVCARNALEHGSGARAEDILRIIQTSRLSSLPDVLDDELVGWLRQYLVEQRIHQALQPILGLLRRNLTPEPGEAQTAMRDVYRVLAAAFLGVQRALPAAAGPSAITLSQKAAQSSLIRSSAGNAAGEGSLARRPL